MYPSIHEQGDLDEGQEAEQRIAAMHDRAAKA
jgi:hypothetical protein